MDETEQRAAVVGAGAAIAFVATIVRRPGLDDSSVANAMARRELPPKVKAIAGVGIRG